VLFLKWCASRAAFVAFTVCLAFTVAGVKFYGATLKHDWVMEHGTAQQGMISVWRTQRGTCMATLNYQLGKDDAPRVDVYASSALCDALAGKAEGPIPIHFIPHGLLKGAVVLDYDFRDAPSLAGRFSRLSWPSLFFIWFVLPLCAVALPQAVIMGTRRSRTFRRFVDFLKTPIG
jgi:hypothetical protein